MSKELNKDLTFHEKVMLFNLYLCLLTRCNERQLESYQLKTLTMWLIPPGALTPKLVLCPLVIFD